MKLIRVRFENVRSVVDGEYGFAHADGRPFDVALVTGPSASGKTTMLEAIAMAQQRIAPAGRPAQPRRFLRAGASNGLVELTLVLDAAERARFGLTDPVAKFGVMLSGAPVEADPRLTRLSAGVDGFDYFPANRSLTELHGTEPPPDAATERRMRLSADLDKYRGVVPWLREQLLRQAGALTTQLSRGGMVMRGDADDPLFELRATLAAMCPWLRLEGLALDGKTPMFLRQDGSSPPVFELSTAEQDALLLSASLERQAYRPSVVMIDRPDLHAHPDDQARWLSCLGARSSCQLIVGATSAALLQAIPAAQHVVLPRP